MTPAEKRLYSKLNRTLKAKGQILKASRGEKQLTELGRFYLLDTEKNVTIMHHINLNAFYEETAQSVVSERLDKLLGVK